MKNFWICMLPVVGIQLLLIFALSFVMPLWAASLASMIFGCPAGHAAGRLAARLDYGDGRI